MSDAPLVSVVTPVYNGAEFLPQCIESVLAQTYRNWDFTIVNNCSTDDTLNVCLKYAAIDTRIRVVTNPSFLNIIENHNRTLSYLSPQAKYCKVVFADDWLFSSCIEELVANAEQHPSVGIVSSYALAGGSWRAAWTCSERRRRSFTAPTWFAGVATFSTNRIFTPIPRHASISCKTVTSDLSTRY